MTTNDEIKRNLENLGNDIDLKRDSFDWVYRSAKHKYSYNFSWMGRRIIQYPQDIIAMQELIWSIQPDLIIETGIAHGGSLVLSASMLELIATCGGTQDSYVLGIDIDIREHNKKEIESHPMFKRIEMIEGSSIDSNVISTVQQQAKQKNSVLVFLDSNHTHQHVYEELVAYAPLTTLNSYCVVFDTIIEYIPGDLFPDRPWGKGDSPKTAIDKFLSEYPQFSIDKQMDAKLMISVAPGGYLKRIS